MENFLEIGIIGVIASAIMEAIKKYVGTEGLLNKGLTIALALSLGGIYFAFSNTAYWQSVVGILAVASTFYAFLLKK